MAFLKPFIFLLITSWAFTVASQVGDEFPLEILETLVEDSDAELDFDQLLEDWKDLQENPLDINKASLEQLSALPFVEANLAYRLIRHRKRFGAYLSIWELQAVEGITYEEFQLLKSLVKIGGGTLSNESFADQLKRGEHQINLRYQRVLEEQKGYLEDGGQPKYEGDQNKLYLRYTYKYKQNIAYGLLAEKDAGESFFSGSNTNGFDYYSAHFFLRHQRWAKAFALGDYSVSLGQGLITWSGFGLGKSSETLRIKKTARPIRPYSSTNEGNFLRGVAYHGGVNDWDFVVYGSSKKRDANRLTIDSAGILFDEVSSLQSSGYHRTIGEIEDKRSLRENQFGGSVKFKKENWDLAANVNHISWDKDIQKGDAPYQSYNLEGTSLLGTSLDGSLQLDNLHFFGEAALSGNGGTALVTGLMASLDPKLDVSFLHRNYSPDYLSLLSKGFGESSTPKNEVGNYLGLHFQPSRKFDLRAYADFFAHPWLKFRVDAPSHGSEYFVQFGYRPLRRTKFYLRWKRENKERNGSVETPIDILVPTQKDQMTLDLKHSVNKTWVLNSRLSLSRFVDNETEYQGSLIYQNVSFKPIGKNYSFSARLAYFDSEDFDSRIYAYEQDLPFSFSIPAFSNRGVRYYANTRYNVNRNLSLWLRFSQTRYSNLTEVGSGNELIEGNIKSEVKAMLRYRIRPKY